MLLLKVNNVYLYHSPKVLCANSPGIVACKLAIRTSFDLFLTWSEEKITPSSCFKLTRIETARVTNQTTNSVISPQAPV